MHGRVLDIKTDGNDHMNTPCCWFSVPINLQLRRLVQASAIVGRKEKKNGDSTFSLIKNVVLFALTSKYTEFESSSDACGVEHFYREATILQIHMAYFFIVEILTGSYECIQPLS